MAYSDKTKCICGSRQIYRIFTLDKERKIILRCKKCALAWTYPPPNMHYKNYNFSDYLKYKKVHSSRPKEILDLLLKFKTKGRLLELGCGVGLLLEMAKFKGFDIKGIDISDIACQKTEKLLGKGVVEKLDVMDFHFRNEKFDCIVINNLLEHIGDPLKILLDIKTVLKGNALVVICSPNIDGLYVKFIREESYILRPNEHIWQFSKIAISNLLNLAGYKPIIIKNIGFINRDLFFHNLRLFRINRWCIKNIFLNSLNYILGKLGFGDMLIIVANKRDDNATKSFYYNS